MKSVHLEVPFFIPAKMPMAWLLASMSVYRKSFVTALTDVKCASRYRPSQIPIPALFGIGVTGYDGDRDGTMIRLGDVDNRTL